MKSSRIARGLMTLGCFVVLGGLEARAGITVFEGSGNTPASIQAVVDSYRAALGTLNPNTTTSFAGGRREINWDGVPDTLSDPNLFPGNFFNAPVAGRARGIEFTTPGTGFKVSADSSNPTNTAPSFGYPNDFVPFSRERVFAAINSLITDIKFFLPGTQTAATVAGFGAVFLDVESAGDTTLEAFDISGNSLFKRAVQTTSSGGLSFLGIQANAGERIASIRLITGNSVLLSNNEFGPGSDGVVMDDFLYAEPAAVVPEPSTIAGLAVGLVGLVGLARRRRASV